MGPCKSDKSGVFPPESISIPLPWQATGYTIRESTTHESRWKSIYIYIYKRTNSLKFSPLKEKNLKEFRIRINYSGTILTKPPRILSDTIVYTLIFSRLSSQKGGNVSKSNCKIVECVQGSIG